MNKEIADTVMQIIEKSSNVSYVTNYYKWKLISQDPDDDKFVDCAISGNANYLVTQDKHFTVLKEIEFPKVEIVDITSFKEI